MREHIDRLNIGDTIAELRQLFEVAFERFDFAGDIDDPFRLHLRSRTQKRRRCTGTRGIHQQHIAAAAILRRLLHEFSRIAVPESDIVKMIALCIVGGIAAGLMHVKAYVMGYSTIMALPIFMDTAVSMAIAVVVGIAVAAAVTYIVGFDQDEAHV